MSLGPLEIGVILLVILIIFGPKNLPKLGAAFGKTVKNVREGMEGAGDDSKADDSQATEAEDVVADKIEAAADVSTAEADTDGARFCPKCGAKNPNTSDFCAKCGAKLV